MKKALCLTLAVLTLLGALVSCGDTETPETTTASAASTTATPEEVTTSNLDANGYEKDSLPADLDYNNDKVTLLYWQDREHEEFTVETQTGEVVNDAIYTRNANVQERLNIELAFVGKDGDASNVASFTNAVQTMIKGGTHDYDLIGTYSLTAGNLATNGLLYDLRTCQYFDWEKPWWPDSLINDATINGKLYFASGDISANVIYMMYVTFFNKQLLEDYSKEDPYKLVESGEWTIDKMFEMCEGVYSDLNSSNTADIGDLYGQYGYTLHLDCLLAGAGIRVIDASDNTLKISDSFTDTKTVDLVEKITNFYKQNDRAYLLTSNDNVTQHFSAGKSLFWCDRCRHSQTFKNNEVSFGVVPVPKYNTDQEEYYSVLGNPFSIYGIPADSRDADEMSAILECYASESYRNVSPALYDITLKYRYTDDETSSRMFDIIRAGVVFDLGRIFASALNKPYLVFEDAVEDGTSWSTVIKANKKAWPLYIKKILEAFE